MQMFEATVVYGEARRFWLRALAADGR